MWLWTGVAYHWAFFSAINKAAYAFGLGFVVQAVLLLHRGLGPSPPTISFRNDRRSWLAGVLLLYALCLYPILGIAAGETWPAIPLFGVTPCPLTIFTWACLLLAKEGISWWLWAVPLSWSIIGGSAALLLSIPQDWILPIAGTIAALSLWTQRRARKIASHHQVPRH